jgi:hypothetical protein
MAEEETEVGSAATPRPLRRRALPERLGEFFAIVFGILVALAGDAWWDTRVERREEREALLALHGEFTTSLRQMQAGMQGHMQSAAAIRELLQWSGPEPRLPDEATVAAVLFRATGSYTTYNDQRGVLEGVIASGGLRLIRNDSLRARLAGWPAIVEDFTEDEVLALELRNREILPFMYRLLPLEGGRFPRDYRALFSDPYFERLMDWRLRQVDSGILPPYRAAIEDLQVIIATIESELGVQGGELTVSGSGGSRPRPRG